MSFSISSLQDYASYAKNMAVTATTLVAGTELEKKLTEATSNEPWGASGTMLTELSRATFSYEDFKVIMAFIWKNLELTGSLWRVGYKTLNMLDHMLRNGSDRVIEDARDHLRELKALHEAGELKEDESCYNIRTMKHLMAEGKLATVES